MKTLHGTKLLDTTKHVSEDIQLRLSEHCISNPLAVNTDKYLYVQLIIFPIREAPGFVLARVCVCVYECVRVFLYVCVCVCVCVCV